MAVDVVLGQADQLAIAQHLEMRLDGCQGGRVGGDAGTLPGRRLASLAALDIAVGSEPVEQVLAQRDAGFVAPEDRVGAGLGAQAGSAALLDARGPAQVELRIVAALRLAPLVFGDPAVVAGYQDVGVGAQGGAHGLIERLSASRDGGRQGEGQQQDAKRSRRPSSAAPRQGTEPVECHRRVMTAALAVDAWGRVACGPDDAIFAVWRGRAG